MIEYNTFIILTNTYLKVVNDIFHIILYQGFQSNVIMNTFAAILERDDSLNLTLIKLIS